MLRCLTIDPAVARPVVGGTHPVQLRPFCLFRHIGGTRWNFTAPFKSTSFINLDIFNVSQKSAGSLIYKAVMAH